MNLENNTHSDTKLLRIKTKEESPTSFQNISALGREVVETCY